MARILVVDDEESILFLVQEMLQDEGFEVEASKSPVQALLTARTSRFDLVVSDVNMGEMFGFQFREEFRKLPGCAEVPFLFMSAADPQAELEIAKSLGVNRLLLKPFSAADLVRAAQVELGAARTEKGAVREVLDGMLHRIAQGRESGILTAVKGPRIKRFVFNDGRLIFAASNDPRDLIGQAMLRAGVISERDLLLAFANRGSEASDGGKRPGLASALAALRKLTPEQCNKIFAGKVRDSVLDVFLWDTGAAEFLSGAVDDQDAAFPMAIDVDAIRAEGLRRRGRWAEVKKVLPDPSTKLERIGAWPPNFPRNVGDQLLAKQLDRRLSISEIQVELRGQAYAIGVRIAELIRAGALRASSGEGFSGAAPAELSPEEIERARVELEITGKLRKAGPRVPEAAPSAPIAAPLATPIAAPVASPPPPEPTGPAPGMTNAIFTRGLILFRSGDLAGAREAFVDVLTVDPLSVLARQRLDEVDRELAKASRKSGLGNEVKLQLAAPIAKLVGQKIAPNDAFVLSRLAAGPRTVGELVVLCPLSEHDLLNVLQGFLDSGMIRKSG